MLFPEIHGRAEDQRGDDGAFAQGPGLLEDQSDGDADEHQHDIDLLAELAHGGADALGDHLDAALHGRAHQVGFQHHGAAEGAHQEGQHTYDQAHRIEAEGDILQNRIQEEIQHGAAQGDVQNLQQLGLAEVLFLDEDLAHEEAAVEQHGEGAHLHADEGGDGGDGGVHRQNADTGLDGEGHGTIDQQDAENRGCNFLGHKHTSFQYMLQTYS